MKLLALTALATALLSIACGGAVESQRDTADTADGRRPGPGPGAGARAGNREAPESSELGLPCSYLHGEATMASRRADTDYASSCFSFEYASQDANVTGNEFDVQYQGDMFIVNMVTDDVSFIVDLGKTPLREVPRTVDPSDYPLGQWREHDAIQAQAYHTYFVRSVDGAGRLVAAFRVLRLEPGRRVDIEWIRSTDADVMAPPLGCLR
jgi:hypothetical protein